MFEIPLRLDDQIPRYPIEDLYHDTEDLWLTVYDREVKGRVRFTGAGKRKYRRYVSLRHTEDLPKHAEPSLWRPFSEWPYELPDSARMTVEQVRPVPKISDPIPAIHLGKGDRWPHAHVRLGRPNEKPECADEAEARYLRAVRTHWLMERVPFVADSVWPQPLIVKAQEIQKFIAAVAKSKNADREKVFARLGFRREDMNDFYVDESELRARPVPFNPTPRDITEYELGRWIEWRPTTDAGLIESQAQNPPPSFYELADTLSTTVAAIARRYESAKEELYRRAIA